jgi:hypothetical protein
VWSVKRREGRNGTGRCQEAVLRGLRQVQCGECYTGERGATVRVGQAQSMGSGGVVAVSGRVVGGGWCNGRQEEQWSRKERRATEQLVGRRASATIAGCGAGAESDGVQRREAIWLSGYLKERRGWEERVDYELDAAHPRRSAGGLCELFSSRLGRGSEALGRVGQRSLRTMAPQLLFDGPAAKPRRPWGSY